MFEDFNIDLEETTPKDWKRSDQIIKVIGVGGGGCNAVSYMYRTGIEGCSFVVCNTDSQALECSPVPVKIQRLLPINTDVLRASASPDASSTGAAGSSSLLYGASYQR